MEIKTIDIIEVHHQRNYNYHQEDRAEIKWFQCLLGLDLDLNHSMRRPTHSNEIWGFFCAEHIRYIAQVMPEWPSKLCHHWTRLMPSTLCQAITRTNPDLRQHWRVEKVRIRSNAVGVQSSQVFTNSGPFHRQFFALNSNLMGISCCCNLIHGHWIATNSCTCHDSYAVLSCAKFGSNHCIRFWMTPNRNF